MPHMDGRTDTPSYNGNRVQWKYHYWHVFTRKKVTPQKINLKGSTDRRTDRWTDGRIREGASVNKCSKQPDIFAVKSVKISNV